MSCAESVWIDDPLCCACCTWCCSCGKRNFLTPVKLCAAPSRCIWRSCKRTTSPIRLFGSVTRIQGACTHVRRFSGHYGRIIAAAGAPGGRTASSVTAERSVMEITNCERQAGGMSQLSATERSADSTRPASVPSPTSTDTSQEAASLPIPRLHHSCRQAAFAALGMLL